MPPHPNKDERGEKGHVQREPPTPAMERPQATVHTDRHEISLLASIEQTVSTLERDIEQATRRVWIEIFIFRADAFGYRMAQKLSEASARGVDVRVLYDSLGSRTTPDAFFDRLRACGVAVRCYRDLGTVLKALRMWPRDHARVLCIDDSLYTGGLGFGDEWLPESKGGLGWHDVCCRVEGELVEQCAKSFAAQWDRYEAEKDAATSCTRWPELEFVADSPLDEEGVYQHYRRAVQAAQARVWIENAYFLPPHKLLDDLYEAAARGVDVQIIVPAASDVPSIAKAAKAEYAAWLTRGLKVFEYLPGVTHAKYAVVDDDWCTIGSFNLNPTSLVCSRESNLFVFEPRFVERVAAQFEHDRACSRPLTLAEVLREPALTRATHQLFRGGVRLFERLSQVVADHPWG